MTLNTKLSLQTIEDYLGKKVLIVTSQDGKTIEVLHATGVETFTEDYLEAVNWIERYQSHKTIIDFNNGLIKDTEAFKFLLFQGGGLKASKKFLNNRVFIDEDAFNRGKKGVPCYSID